MIQLLTYHEIDPQQWSELVQSSPTATWFQTKETYEFYTSVSTELAPFAVGIEENGHLVGVIVGYTTQETNPIKQLLTCRSIIIGGPLLDEHISSDALITLLVAVKQVTKKAIYVETRNFNDYSKWKEICEQCGFAYQPHLNFHVDTSSVGVVDKNLGKSRKRDIRTTIRDGVTPVYQPTIEQVKQYYQILQNLYTTKVKTPLFSWNFFEQLHRTEHARFILTEYQGRIIGGTVCVELPNRALYEWFACGEDGVYDHIYPSCYATYLGIKYAAESGCQIFDMMGAGKPEEAYGVRDFKAKFGGELVEHGRFLCVCKPLLYWIGKTGVKLLKRK